MLEWNVRNKAKAKSKFQGVIEDIKKYSLHSRTDQENL